MYKEDAFRALEHGNDNTSLPQYDLCFGGRRAFCRSKYADLGKKVDHIINIYIIHICIKLLASCTYGNYIFFGRRYEE